MSILHGNSNKDIWDSIENDYFCVQGYLDVFKQVLTCTSQKIFKFTEEPEEQHSCMIDQSAVAIKVQRNSPILFSSSPFMWTTHLYPS